MDTVTLSPSHGVPRVDRRERRVNDSAVAVLDGDQLLMIARELTEQVRAGVMIDWTSARTSAPSSASL